MTKDCPLRCTTLHFVLRPPQTSTPLLPTELERLSADGPVDCTEEQLWVLLRAVKVQSQVLEIYTEQPLLV